jgi:DNA-binding transcriptional ArsR family regulator
VTVLLALPLVASTGAARDTPALQGPFSVAIAADPGGKLAAAAFSNGSTLIASTDLTELASSIQLIEIGSTGRVVMQPIRPSTSSDHVRSVSVAITSRDVGVVAWVGTGTVNVISLRAGTGVSSASIPLGGLDPAACKIAAGLSNAAIACSMSDPTSGAGSPETYGIMLDSDGTPTTGPFLLSRADGNYSVLEALTIDASGRAWVAFKEPAAGDPLNDSLTLAVSDAAGGIALSDISIGGAPKDMFSLYLAPEAGATGAVIAGIAKQSPSTGNAEVKLKSFGPTGAPTGAELTLTDPVAPPAGLQLVRGGASASEMLVEWFEKRPADQPASGLAAWRAVYAIVDSNLSLTQPPTSTDVILGDPVVAATGSGDLIGFDSTMVIYRWSFAAPTPPSGVDSGLPLPLIIVLGVAMGGLIPLALAEERLRWGFFGFLLPLYARLRKEKIMIDNLRRGALLQIIIENPGIRFRELSRRSRIPDGPLAHHLRVLSFHGFVSKRSTKREVRFYPEGKNPIAEEPYDEIREKIIREIRSRPGITHSQLAKAVGLQWATLLYHLDLMHEEGLLKYRTRRGRRRYWAPDPTL